MEDDLKAWIDHLNMEIELLETTLRAVDQWNRWYARGYMWFPFLCHSYEFTARVGLPFSAAINDLTYNGGPYDAVNSYHPVSPHIHIKPLTGCHIRGGVPIVEGSLRVEARVLRDEITAILLEVCRLQTVLEDMHDYAPGGQQYSRLVRQYAQSGMTRYALRPLFELNKTSVSKKY